MTDTQKIVRPRVLGDARANMAAEMAGMYEAGESIRTVAAHFERSYGLTHTLLVEAGVELRPRGGYHGAA